MERKEAVKIENIVGSSMFPDYVPSTYPSLQGVFDFTEVDKSSLGFMELLGVQDFGPPMFDVLQVPSLVQSSAQNYVVSSATKVDSPEVVNNQPATPNSNSSISSASSEALNDDQAPVKAVENDVEVEEQQKTKKELKSKKTNQKRQRQPRFAFMTKSEVDHLEDGYRWRKYGQKAVKNSPFPRSYYRCTTASCNVKKRVERSFSDTSIVVTTYEGQHTHPSPVMPRPSLAGPYSESGFSALSVPFERRISSLYQQHHQQHHFNGLSPLGFGYNGSTNGSFVNDRRFRTASGSALLKDHGLLQDLVPSHMLKEE